MGEKGGNNVDQELQKNTKDPSQAEPGLATLLQQKVELEAQIEGQFFREKTFMALDVQKSTDLKKGKAKDDVFLTFDAYHKLVKRAAESNAGQVHETAGDGIMCVFDTADDACRAGIAIVASMPEFNRKQNRLKKPVVLRIGINTGRVLYDENRGIGELFDGVIDVAGHLQKEGCGGALLITQAAYDAVSDKNIFVKDKYWEAKQTQLYRYGVQTDAASDPSDEYGGFEKITPMMDAVGGKSSREIKLGDIVWVRRQSGVFAEGKVTLCQSDTDFCRLVVTLPDGVIATANIRVSIRICVTFDRADAAARKMTAAPQYMRFTGSDADALPGIPSLANMPPQVVLWGGLALAAILFLICLVLLIK